MKTLYKLSALLTIFLIGSNISFGQCKADECISKISEGYTFLKTYQMEKVGDQSEYSYVFSKDTNYMLVVCNKDGASDVVVTLFDSNRKEIASNFDKKSGKHYPAIIYNCKSTGIYYLKFTFSSQKPDCCISVLAFKK